MVKITEFMIGVIVTSFIIAVFGLFMAEMNANYGVSYDNSSLSAYNQMDDMSKLAEDLDESQKGIKEKTGILDIIGGYFTDAYNVLKLTKNSYDMFDTMSNQAIEDANLGKAGKYLRIMISAIILILIVIGVIISAIIKRDL